jgi:hypothetical protein
MLYNLLPLTSVVISLKIFVIICYSIRPSAFENLIGYAEAGELFWLVVLIFLVFYLCSLDVGTVYIK